MFGWKSCALGLLTLLGTGALPADSFCAETPGASRGRVVRLTPPKRIDIPGVLTFEGERRLAAGPVREEDGGALVVVESEGRTWHVPMPGRPLVGELVATDERSVTIIRDASRKEITIPRPAIDSIAVRTGRHSRWRGAAIVGGVGAAIGVAAGFASEDGWFSQEETALMAGVMFGVLGAGIGAAVPPGEQWEVLDLGAVRVGCHPALSGRGPGLSITLTF